MKRFAAIGVLAILAAFLISTASAAAKPTTATLYYGNTTYPVLPYNCPTDYPSAYVNQTPSHGDPSGKVAINVSAGTGKVSISHATANTSYSVYLYDASDCGNPDSPWDASWADLNTDRNGRGSATFTFSGLSSGDTVIAEVYYLDFDWFASLRFQL
jgi:hypothetical protein